MSIFIKDCLHQKIECIVFGNKDVSHLTYSKIYDVYNKTQIGSLMAHNEPLVITKAPKINKLYYNIM